MAQAALSQPDISEGDPVQEAAVQPALPAQILVSLSPSLAMSGCPAHCLGLVALLVLLGLGEELLLSK